MIQITLPSELDMPTSIMTEALISAIRTHPQLPRHSWYFISGVTLSALNRPEEIATVYSHAIGEGVDEPQNQPSQDERLEISRKLREALVKSSAICGLPKVGVIFSVGWLCQQLSIAPNIDDKCAIGAQKSYSTDPHG